MLYSSVPGEPTCLSELLMRIDTSVRNVCQHNYFCIQHCHFVNSTQISDVIKRLRFGKSDVLIIYTQTILNMAQVIFSIVFQLLLIVCYVMDMHLPVFCMLLLYQFPKMLN